MNKLFSGGLILALALVFLVPARRMKGSQMNSLASQME